MTNLFKSKQTIQKNEELVQYKRGTLYTYFTKSLQKAYFNPDLPVKITFEVRKDADGKSTYLEGVATDTNVDFDGDRLTYRCLQGLSNSINSGSIPFQYGHKNIRLGHFEGSVIDGDRLLVRAKFDDPTTNPAVTQVLRQIGAGTPFGFSIGGEGTGRIGPSGRKEISSVKLAEISLVEQPANARATVDALIRKHWN